jgi:hypothetical protein
MTNSEPRGFGEGFKFLASLKANVTEYIDYGKTPLGERLDAYFEGELVGDMLAGKMKGIDYTLTRSDGFAELNVRAAITTDDGANISAEIFGYFEKGNIKDACVKLMTGNEKYQWLCSKIIIGKGKGTPETLDIDYFYEP